MGFDGGLVVVYCDFLGLYGFMALYSPSSCFVFENMCVCVFFGLITFFVFWCGILMKIHGNLWAQRFLPCFLLTLGFTKAAGTGTSFAVRQT